MLYKQDNTVEEQSKKPHPENERESKYIFAIILILINAIHAMLQSSIYLKTWNSDYPWPDGHDHEYLLSPLILSAFYVTDIIKDVWARHILL